MESEKVKEIKNGLECLSGHRPCNLCFYHELAEQQETCCINLVAEDVIDYINELESENERLQRDYVVKAYDELRAENKKLKDRIAELEKRCHFIWALGYDYDGCEKAESLKSLIDELVGIAQGNWGDVCSKCENKQDNLINDKLKQFAERLKEKLIEFNSVNNGLWLVDTQVLIDETLKEFIND